jgi:hypothetical protein
MTKKLQRMTQIVILPQIVSDPPPKNYNFLGGVGTICQGRIEGTIASPHAKEQKLCVICGCAPPPLPLHPLNRRYDRQFEQLGGGGGSVAAARWAARQNRGGGGSITSARWWRRRGRQRGGSGSAAAVWQQQRRCQHAGAAS